MTRVRRLTVTTDSPEPLNEATRRKLSAQSSRDTKPELLLRRELHSRGLRYRVDESPLGEMPRRRADIVFGPSRVAVFVDGCFWHLCPQHGRVPKNNREWWERKLNRNVRRDLDTTARLQDAGWLVLRFWEHDDVQDAADQVQTAVETRRP